jgi:hypothetical protein
MRSFFRSSGAPACIRFRLVSQVPPFAWFSARDKLVGAIFALNEARAGERQMSGDEPPFVGSKLI